MAAPLAHCPDLQNHPRQRCRRLGAKTIPNYTWAQVSDDIAEQIVGREAGDLLWEDGLGAGAQIALFGRCRQILKHTRLSPSGTKVREWCPLSWWAMDMPPEDWAQQCADAAEQGYMSSKLKARTWYDLHAAIGAIIEDVPSQFKLDLDFNATLANAANAVEFLKTPRTVRAGRDDRIPDPSGAMWPGTNRSANESIDRWQCTTAPHPILTTLHEDVADGFVIGVGAYRLLKQATVCEEANKPFWPATRRHWYHHNMGSPSRRRMSASKVARDYLHEHLGEPTHHRTD